MTTLQLALSALVGAEAVLTALLGIWTRRIDRRAAAALERAEEALAVRKGMRRSDTPQ